MSRAEGLAAYTEAAAGLEALRQPQVAVLIPCYNEEAAIGTVVSAFRAALPQAAIHVYDNNSTDRTIEVASAAGAVVRREARQGKAAVVRRMFSDVEADIYILVDGDATYDAPSAGLMIETLVKERFDMVVATRVHQDSAAFRPGHQIGNRLFSAFVASIFGATFTDILSGYRVFSRRFVKSFPVLSRGFEIEIELAVHALALELPVAEVSTPYYARPQGSASKLSTWRDGSRILVAIMQLYRYEHPLAFFSMIGFLLVAISIVLATPIFITFIETGLVPRFPTAILSTGLMLLAFLSIACGLILDTVTRGRRETKRLAYLRHRAPGEGFERGQP
jgi:glycosyltransferase involved in cell wall biosynthesis